MSYTIKGFLHGFLCRECVEPLSGMTVRVYRAVGVRAGTDASAREKETYHLLSDEDLEGRGKPLGAGEIDANGRYDVVFDEDADYNREDEDQYIWVDVFANTIPGAEEARATISPVQFSITTLLPRWEERESGWEAAFNHEISAKFWCAVRARLGVWVICGRVVNCETQAPLPRLRVRAFDTDWIQDDPLGSAMTDANGRYRIYYTRQTFRRTPLPWISWEMRDGPDVYFRVESSGGTPLLVENRSRGRHNDRENVGPCFCEDLCLLVDPEDVPPPESDPAEPQFDHVGKYALPQVIATAPGEKKINDDGYAVDADPLAFTGNIDLIGTLPNGGATPKEYRFRYAEFNPATSAYGPLKNVEKDMIAPSRIGSLQYYTLVGSALQLVSESYYVNHSAAAHNVTVKPGGWIEVPTENDKGDPFTNTTGSGKFVRSTGLLITMKTTGIIDELFDLVVPTVHQAGNGLAASQKSRVRTYQLVFESQDVGGGNARSDELAKIVITNTTYKQRRHPSWNVNEPSLPAVVMLDVAELQGAGSGCKQIDAQLHALYTVYNPHLKSASVSFEGNAPLPPAHTATVSGGEAVSPAGGHPFTTSAMVECAFIVWLRVVLNITHGYGRPSSATLDDRIAICVNH